MRAAEGSRSSAASSCPTRHSPSASPVRIDQSGGARGSASPARKAPGPKGPITSLLPNSTTKRSGASTPASAATRRITCELAPASAPEITRKLRSG